MIYGADNHYCDVTKFVQNIEIQTRYVKKFLTFLIRIGKKWVFLKDFKLHEKERAGR